MAKNVPGVNAQQGQLFREVRGIGTIPVANFPGDSTLKLLGYVYKQQVFESMPGPHVELIFRAANLIDALTSFGHRNQRLGFDTASNTRPHSPEIWGRYQGKTPIVQEGAEANAEKYLLRAKTSFWRATGFTALRDVNYAPRKSLDAMARKMWRDFSATYGDHHHRKERDNYKKVLKRSKKICENVLQLQLGA